MVKKYLEQSAFVRKAFREAIQDNLFSYSSWGDDDKPQELALTALMHVPQNAEMLIAIMTEAHMSESDLDELVEQAQEFDIDISDLVRKAKQHIIPDAALAN